MSPALRALLRLELRAALPFTIVAMVLIGLIPLLPWAFTGSVPPGLLPDVALVALLPALAAALGGDAIATDRASGAWSFVTTRAVATRSVLALRFAARLLLALAWIPLTQLIVRAWSPSPPAWIEAIDAPARSGIVLALLGIVACFSCAFFAGTKLRDPVIAALGGMLGGAVIVAALLAPGLLATGSLRGALEGPGEWIAARRVRSGEGSVVRACVQRSGLAVALQLRDRVVILGVDAPPHVTAGAGDRGRSATVLSRGTTLQGWSGTELAVTWPSGVSRVAGLDGRTRPRDDGDAIDGSAGSDGTCESVLARAHVRDGRVILMRDGERRTIWPPEPRP